MAGLGLLLWEQLNGRNPLIDRWATAVQRLPCPGRANLYGYRPLGAMGSGARYQQVAVVEPLALDQDLRRRATLRGIPLARTVESLRRGRGCGHRCGTDRCALNVTLREAWEANADDWTAWARRPGHDSYWRFHRDAFLALVPPPGRLTLDVGCGEGRVARDLAAMGHRVFALEPTRTLSLRAAEAGGGLLAVLRADGAHLPILDSAADLVVAFMTLQDVDDMQGAVHEIGRVLRPGGRLCLAVEHPINSGGRFRGEEFAMAGDYFEARRVQLTVERDGLCMAFDGWHWSLEDYFAPLEGAGLLTEELREPRPRNGGHWDRVPLFLDLRAVRP